MTHYKRIAISVDDPEIRGSLIALMDAAGYEGFEETADQLLAFIPGPAFDEAALQRVLQPFSLHAEQTDLEPQNWNALWESNFQPVIIDDFCTVRAAFHPPAQETQYEILITPKMSFGTGHHATTRLMVQALRSLSVSGKTVLDFGTGTGILAILAAKMGAKSVTAVDYDAWSYENAAENFSENEVAVSLCLGGWEAVPSGMYDIILANINRHVLTEHMMDMYQASLAGGVLVLSGILLSDRDRVLPVAEKAGWVLREERTGGEWMAMQLVKK